MATVRFRVLGALEVEVDGVAAELGGARQRAVLAVLLMHANEPVGTDRLVSESWGETAPPSATKTAQVYVSRLRRALGNDTLTTTPGGYLLHVPHGALDTDELDELRARAREADPPAAARLLRQGLALWRGPPYADLRYEAALQTEITRLEELHLTTLEDRIEADLAGGEASQLVPELEALVREHPLRERLRGFLMLALYRTGRQAEALETYREGRQLLDTELGLEPGVKLRELERAILAHDPALDGPQRVTWRTTRRRSGALLAAGGVLLLAAALTAIVFVRDRGVETPSGGAGAEALDPQTGNLLATVPLGAAPSSVAVGAGAVWVLNADDKTISVIDPETRSRESFSTSSTPTDLAAGAGALWIGNAFRELPFSATSYPESVSRLDPETRVVVDTIRLPLPRPSVVRFNPASRFNEVLEHIAVTSDAVWVVGADLGVYRIDPRTNERVGGRVNGVDAVGIAAGGGGVWVIEFGTDNVAKIDPRTNTITQRIRVASEGLSSIAVGTRDLWAADPFGGLVWRIDPGLKLPRRIPLDLGVSWVAVGAGAVWATNELAGRVYRIDPSTNKAHVVRRTDGPATVAVGGGAAWVSVAGPPPAGTALPSSVCSKIAPGGEANPRFLIVSDLPLKGSSNIAATHQMVEAIRLVLERRGYRAGAYTIGYQSCDDSTAQGGGWDSIRCYSNAKAYARNPAVIGIVGSYNSSCSEQEIPVANQVPNGPLAMISPASTDTALTRLVRGVNNPEDLEHRYPTGERNFVRTAAAGHLTATAMAQFAKQKGVKRLFLSWNGGPYFAAYAADVGRAAKSLGIQIAGAAPFEPEARNYAQFARRIASTRSDGVVLAGYPLPSTPSLLRDLRAGLGTRVTLIGSEGYRAPDFFRVAGPAALGMYIAFPGADISLLPPAGKRFMEELEARTGKPGEFYTASAAQSTEILLSAIARSDGTRASVTKELFKTRVENGILGDIRFDKNGDPVEAPITIWRIVAPSRAPNGYAADRVIIGRSALLP
jgi:DNA-binding SARP family transcriptional activator/ABC-type branched-subunit amino acid transport system substrate-binding protein/DNA-binding beta-propeller fold protein YncE